MLSRFLSHYLNPFAERIQRRGFYFDLLLPLLVGAESLRRLLPFSDPPGLNGYFYLKQTKTLAQSLSFYFSDHSLAFAPIVLFRWMLGSDLRAFQLAIAAALAGCIWAVCFLVNQSKAKATERLLAKLVITAALFSSSYFGEFALNFYKNLVATSLLVACAGFLLSSRPRPAFLLFFAAFLTHKSVALVGVIYLLFYAAGEVRKNWKEREGLRKTVWLLGITGLCAGLFGILFLYHFPKAAAFLEHARQNFGSPAARLAWWKVILLQRPHRASEIVVWMVLLLSLAISLRSLQATARTIFLTSATVFLLAVHPFQPPGSAALGYRLLLMLPLLLYPLLALALNGRPAVSLVAGLAMLGGSLPFFSPLAFPVEAISYETRSYSPLRADVEKIPSLVHPEDHLTSHHGMEFFVDYVTDIRSRSFLADPAFEGKRFRLVYAAPAWTRASILGDEIDQVKLLDVGNSYYLMQEEDWLNINAWMKFPRSWKNPARQRPAHVYE